MTLGERLGEYVRAAFSGIWIQTHEQDDAIREIAQVARQNDWTLATWDIDRGLKLNGWTADEPTPLDSAIAAGKQDRTFVVVLSPVVQLPAELERQFVIIEHELPGKDQLEQIARSIATEPGDLPEGDDLGMVLDAAAGLTRMEAENAFSLSLVRHGRVLPDTLWELKTGMLKKSGLLTLHRGGETFSDLGGLDALKGFSRKALRGSRRDTGVRPRGVLLLGVPGTGKSAFAKALGNETGRPTLILDVGSLMG